MLKQDDHNDFFTAIDKEASGHDNGNNLEIAKKAKESVKIIKSI